MTEPTQTTLAPTSTSPPRMVAVDVFRGLVMVLMIAEVFHWSTALETVRDQPWAALILLHTDHVKWIGCVLHDLIQPSFSFLVGVAMVYSLANRKAAGQATWKTALHVLWRCFMLIALGILLRSIGEPQTYFTFEDTLTQIGLGYGFLYLIALARPKVAWWALVILLLGYWLAFLIYPAPGKDFPWQTVALPENWEHMQGLAAHWDFNSNAAWAFDKWFLNLFPRKEPFLYNEGGYCTLSFIPTLGTMLLGLQAGRILHGAGSKKRVLLWLLAAALIGWAAGLLWHYAGCPIVKRIWTPSWTLFSAGSCFALLAGFYLITEILQWRSWAFPLLVVGANSIVAYVIAHLWPDFLRENWRTHVGHLLEPLPPATEALCQSGLVFLTLWLFLYWMYRRKLFIKI